MKKSGILIAAVLFGFFSCASKPVALPEPDINSSGNGELSAEMAEEPIQEPEVLTDEGETELEEIEEPEVSELPPEDDNITEYYEDDEIEFIDDEKGEILNFSLENDELEGSQNLENAKNDFSADGSLSDNTTEDDNAITSLNNSELSALQNQNKSDFDSKQTDKTDGADAIDENSEESLENDINDNFNVDEDSSKNDVEEYSYPVSRSVTLKVYEYLDVSYPGSGWIYMGATDNSKNITYFGRKLGTQNTNFSLQARNPGTKILHFYKNDTLTNQIIDDYIEVIVLEERGSNQTHVEAPEYKMPVKSAKPASKAAHKEVEGWADQTKQTEQTEQASALKTEQISFPDEVETVEPEETEAEKPQNNSSTKPNSTYTENYNSNSDDVTASQESNTNVQNTETRVEELLKSAKDALSQKNYKIALDYINEYISNSKDGRDEALFIQGQALEAKSDFQDIPKAIESYTTLTNNYPASKYWDKANKRIIYLKRFYLQGR